MAYRIPRMRTFSWLSSVSLYNFKRDSYPDLFEMLTVCITVTYAAYKIFDNDTPVRACKWKNIKVNIRYIIDIIEFDNLSDIRRK